MLFVFAVVAVVVVVVLVLVLAVVVVVVVVVVFVVIIVVVVAAAVVVVLIFLFLLYLLHVCIGRTGFGYIFWWARLFERGHKALQQQTVRDPKYNNNKNNNKKKYLYLAATRFITSHTCTFSRCACVTFIYKKIQ